MGLALRGGKLLGLPFFGIGKSSRLAAGRVSFARSFSSKSTKGAFLIIPPAYPPTSDIRGANLHHPIFPGKPSRKRPTHQLRSSTPAWAGVGLRGHCRTIPPACFQWKAEHFDIWQNVEMSSAIFTLLKARTLQVLTDLVALLVPGMHNHHRIIRPYVVFLGNFQHQKRPGQHGP